MVRGSLERRLRALEGRNPQEPPPSRTLEDARAIDAEIARIEREMIAHGMNPYAPPDAETKAFFESLEGLTLDEKIAALEEEIEQCPEG